MDIHTLREKVLAGAYHVSRHADIERQHESLSVEDLTNCVLSGEIVDEDVDPERGVEYLVESRLSTGGRLRVKLGIDDADELVFVTVYLRRQRRGGGRAPRRSRRSDDD